MQERVVRVRPLPDPHRPPALRGVPAHLVDQLLDDRAPAPSVTWWLCDLFHVNRSAHHTSRALTGTLGPGCGAVRREERTWLCGRWWSAAGWRRRWRWRGPGSTSRCTSRQPARVARVPHRKPGVGSNRAPEISMPNGPWCQPPPRLSAFPSGTVSTRRAVRYADQAWPETLSPGCPVLRSTGGQMGSGSRGQPECRSGQLMLVTCCGAAGCRVQRLPSGMIGCQAGVARPGQVAGYGPLLTFPAATWHVCPGLET